MNARSVIVLSALFSASAFAAPTTNPANPGDSTSATSGATSTASAASASTSEPKPRHGDCIFTRMIDGWTVLDDQSLIVYAPTHNTPYLVKLWRPEFDLKWANTLGFVDRDNNGMICDRGPDSILLRQFGSFPDRVPVNSVQRIDKDQAKALIAKSKVKPESPAAVMPDQSDMKSDKSGAQKSDQSSDQSKDQPKT